MEGGQNNLMTLIFLVIAVLIFLKLRSVLGRRTGDEPARFERYRSERAAAEAQAAAKAEGKVVTLPRRERDAATETVAPQQTDADRAHRMTQYAAGNAVLARGLIAIAAADPRFEPAEFVRGAKAAYEAVVMGFAEGNRTLLKDLLSAEVFDGFARAIDEREARRERIEQSFVGIKSAELTEADLRGRAAYMTVTFVSELITVTRNMTNEIVAGDPKRIRDVTDVWTFARDVGAANPNWRLVSTQAAG